MKSSILIKKTNLTEDEFNHYIVQLVKNYLICRENKVDGDWPQQEHNIKDCYNYFILDAGLEKIKTRL